MNTQKKGILLVNLGSPASPEIKEVRKFLREFLNDKYVIDIPALFRFLLVNGIIVPFRTPKSTRLYRQLWQGKNESPLMLHSQNVKNQLQICSNNKVQYYLAMRYGEPSIKNVFKQIRKDNIEQLSVLPLYPQYAQSTTQSVIEKVRTEIKKARLNIKTTFIEDFYNHSGYLNALVANIQQADVTNYDHVLFSFHGLPLSQIDKIHKKIDSKACSCKTEFPIHGKKCYKAQCYETMRLLVKQLELKEGCYSLAFQSHLSEKWLQPFSSHKVKELAKKGIMKLLVVAPSFVCDNLETIVEIDQEFKHILIKNGGKKLQLVKGLNSEEEWIKGIKEILADG